MPDKCHEESPENERRLAFLCESKRVETLMSTVKSVVRVRLAWKIAIIVDEGFAANRAMHSTDFSSMRSHSLSGHRPVLRVS